MNEYFETTAGNGDAIRVPALSCGCPVFEHGWLSSDYCSTCEPEMCDFEMRELRRQELNSYFDNTPEWVVRI